VQSCLSSADGAIGSVQFPSGGTPAGTLAVLAADLRVHGARSVTVAGAAPQRGQETVFARPVLSAPAFAAAQDAAARAHLHTLNIPGRDRHSAREQKARPKFPHTSATKQTVTGKYQVIVYAPGSS
jgi:hypothetical protein